MSSISYRFISVPEAALAGAVTEDVITGAINTGELQAAYEFATGQYRIYGESWKDWLAQHSPV